MTDLILQLILLSSFAVIVYLMAVAVPRVKDDELNVNGSKSKMTSVLPLDQMDAFLNNWKEKVLRRLRIYLMKAERGVTNQLHKSREVYEKGREKRSFPKLKRRFSRHQESDLEESPNQENLEEQGLKDT